MDNKVITQDDFLKLSAEEKQKLDIGTLIHLNNEYCDCYRVIHKDKDSIYLMANYQVITMDFGRNRNSNANNDYKNSKIRKWLNSIYLNNFDESISEAMKIMKVDSNGKILKDKVKILSCTELGITGKSIRDDEGELYTEINPSYIDYNEIDQYKYNDKGKRYPFSNAWGDISEFGRIQGIWTRSNSNSKYLDDNEYGYIIEIYGSNCHWENHDEYYGILPVISF